MVDSVSIVKLSKNIFKEVVERIQMELSQAHDKIVISPFMCTEIQGSLKDLFKSFVQVEEAKANGQETHHRILSSLDQIGKWESKLATLGNVARRNILPNIPLLSLDEVVTCKNVLAKIK